MSGTAASQANKRNSKAVTKDNKKAKTLLKDEEEKGAVTD